MIVTSGNDARDNQILVVGRTKTTMGYDHIFEALITIVIGLALLPVIRTFVAAGQNGSSTSESILLGLVSLFWVLAVVAVAVYMAKKGMGK